MNLCRLDLELVLTDDDPFHLINVQEHLVRTMQL